MTDRKNDMLILTRASEIVAGSSDLEDAIMHVMNEIAEQYGILQAYFTVLNRNSSKLKIEVAYGLTNEEKQRGEYLIGEGIIGEVVRTGKPIIIPHISDELRFLNKTRSTTKKTDDDTFICVPVQAKSKVIGTLKSWLTRT